MKNEELVAGEVSHQCHSFVALTEEDFHQEMRAMFRLPLEHLSAVGLP